MNAATETLPLEERLARVEQEAAGLRQALQLILAVVTAATEGGDGR